MPLQLIRKFYDFFGAGWQSGRECIQHHGNLLQNDRDIDSAKSSLRITGVRNETNGTAVFNNNNTPDDTTDDLIIFTPNPGFSGTSGTTVRLS